MRFSGTLAKPCLLVALSLSFGWSQAQTLPAKKVCSDVEKIKNEASKNDGLRTVLANPISSSRCSTLLNILRQIASAKISAGRQLEANAAFDPRAAQAQLDAARADPEIHAAIAAEMEGVSDPGERLLLEAVVMHDKQKLHARNLLIQQLDPGRKP